MALRLTPLRRLKYYNNCIFFNVQKDFIIQSGDPTNTGKGGDSLNKCVRRRTRDLGLLALAPALRLPRGPCRCIRTPRVWLALR